MTADEIHQSPLVHDESYELVDGRRRYCARYPPESNVRNQAILSGYSTAPIRTK